MPTDLEQRVIDATPSPTKPVPVREILADARRRRLKRWIAAAAATSAVAAVATVVGFSLIAGPAPDPPTIHPLGPSVPEAHTQQPEAAQDAWMTAEPGETITLSPQMMEELSTIDRRTTTTPWNDEIRNILLATTATWEAPDGGRPVKHITAAVAVDSDGRALVAPLMGSDALILVTEDGATLLDSPFSVAESQRPRAVAAVPAGGWIAYGTDHDGQATIARILPDGRLDAQVALEPAPPDRGGILRVNGHNVWLINSFESVDLDRGPQATLVARNAGRTLVGEVDWRPADQVLPDSLDKDPFTAASGGDALATFNLVEGGTVSIGYDHTDSLGSLHLDTLYRASQATTLGTGLSVGGTDATTGANGATATATSRWDLLAVVEDDSVHLGKLGESRPPFAPGPVLQVSPDGTVWQITLDPDAITIADLALPPRTPAVR